MYPNPEIEKLRAKQKQGQKKLEQLQHREQQLQNRIRYLEGAERRQRNHRLITRGAAVEHLWPEVKSLSEQDFYSLMELILMNIPAPGNRQSGDLEITNPAYRKSSFRSAGNHYTGIPVGGNRRSGKTGTGIPAKWKPLLHC